MLLNFEWLGEYRRMLYCPLPTEATNNEAVNFSDPVVMTRLILHEFCVSLENQPLVVCSLRLC
jgi:hypothetical protein